MKKTVTEIQEILKERIKVRSEARKEVLKKYEGRSYEQTTSANFKPLASDIIQDPKHWPEWKLNDRMQVIRR